MSDTEKQRVMQIKHLFLLLCILQCIHPCVAPSSYFPKSMSVSPPELQHFLSYLFSARAWSTLTSQWYTQQLIYVAQKPLCLRQQYDHLHVAFSVLLLQCQTYRPWGRLCTIKIYSRWTAKQVV